MNHIDLKNKTVLVTGSAGFIGSNLVLELLKTQSPIHIIGLDNMNDYYDVSIKEWRLEEIEKCLKKHSDSSYVFYKDDLANKAIIDHIFEEHKPDIVVNLGAQAGVRYSISNPDAYIQSNMIGFYNILEACRHSYDNGAKGVEHLVYASSSSVYGSNKNDNFCRIFSISISSLDFNSAILLFISKIEIGSINRVEPALEMSWTNPFI